MICTAHSLFVIYIDTEASTSFGMQRAYINLFLYTVAELRYLLSWPTFPFHTLKLEDAVVTGTPWHVKVRSSCSDNSICGIGNRYPLNSLTDRQKDSSVDQPVDRSVDRSLNCSVD